MHDDGADPDPTHAPGSLRCPTGRGRPYPPEVVAAVRALVEGTALRFAEIAGRTGAGEATVARWTRRFRWRRPPGAKGSSIPSQEGQGEPAAAGRGEDSPGWVLPTPARDSRDRRCASTLASLGTGEASASEPRPGRAGAGRYGPRDHEAARALVEGSRLGLERIGLALGIGTATLSRWQKRFRWRRPAPPDRPGPMFYRSRRRGRPYGGDAVGTARDLVTGTLLSQARIAVRAGVSQATVSNWIARRGWVRPAAEPGSRRFAASRRTAPTAASGDRRGRAYGPDTVAEAMRLWQQTLLPSANIAARVKVSAVTVARWANARGWTRPRDLPDAHGRYRRRRRRR